MDSERRHELEKNDLDVLLRVKGPEFLQKHGANILLGILLLAAIVYFIVQKRKAREQEIYSTNLNTAVAYNYAMQLRDMASHPDLSDEAARDRQELAAAAFAAADLVLASDSDAQQKASAQLAKAETLWALATAPPRALATTQPVAGFAAKAPEAYLEDARAAYYEILQKYPDNKEIAANALLAMAAISETNLKFDEAAEWYQKVIQDQTLRGVYREMAQARLKQVDELKRPYTLAAPTSRPSLFTPTTQSLMVEPGSPGPSAATPATAPAPMAAPATTQP